MGHTHACMLQTVIGGSACASTYQPWLGSEHQSVTPQIWTMIPACLHAPAWSPPLCGQHAQCCCSTCCRRVTILPAFGRSLLQVAVAGPRPRWGRQAFGAQWRDMGAVMHMPVLTSASDGFPVPLAAAASFCDNPMSIAVSACVVVGRLSGYKGEDEEHVMALPPVPPGG